MIPKLFSATETAFTSEGLGRLTECTSCHVKEVRNSEYECEFVYPVTGRLFAAIEDGAYIACTHNDDGDIQPFIIYRRSAPINGLVTFNARHISYLLNNVIVSPFECNGVTEALQALRANSINNNPFTFTTDKTTTGAFKVEEPRAIRQILGGEGGLLDVFGGGEYEFNMFNVALKAHRGTASGVTIRYGKNLADIDQVKDSGDTFNAVVPFWRGEVDEVDTLITVPGFIVAAPGVTVPVPVVLDMSSEFTDPPSTAELQQAAADYLANATPWLATESIKVDFVQLWQTAEYAAVANLQRLRLCDTVSVIYPALGVTAHNIKVVSVDYDVLAGRYASMELGQVAERFEGMVATIGQIDGVVNKAVADTRGFMDAAISAATSTLAGAHGGHLVIVRNADGEPEELLIMDTDSLLTATNIIRMNLAGIGFSTDGGQTYSTAWTIGGRFVADYIQSGTLRAILIEGPTSGTYWDLSTGILQHEVQRSIDSYHIDPDGTDYEPYTFTLNQRTRLSSSGLTVCGERDGETEERIFTDASVQNSPFLMGTQYYEERLDIRGNSPFFLSGDMDNFVRGGFRLRGEKITSYAVSPESDEMAESITRFAKFIPEAFVDPDNIRLGSYTGLESADGTPLGTRRVNRNVLFLQAGFANMRDAVVFRENVSPYRGRGTSLVYYHANSTPRFYRPVWPFKPGDVFNIPNGMHFWGCIYGNGEELRLTIPIARPMSEYITGAEFTGGRLGIIRAVSGSSLMSAQALPAHTTTLQNPGAKDCVLDISISRNSGNWGSTTAGQTVMARFTDCYITFLDTTE